MSRPAYDLTTTEGRKAALASEMCEVACATRHVRRYAREGKIRLALNHMQYLMFHSGRVALLGNNIAATYHMISRANLAYRLKFCAERELNAALTLANVRSL